MTQKTGPLRLEVDGDELTDEQMAEIEKRGFQLELDDEVYDDVDALIEQEDREREGIWVPFDAIAGAAVLVARASNARTRYQKLERNYRAKKRLRADQDTPPEAQEALLCDAWFGRAIKGWKGFRRKGKDMEFSLDNFRWMWRKSERFMSFCLQHTTRIESAMHEVLEDVSGN